MIPTTRIKTLYNNESVMQCLLSQYWYKNSHLAKVHVWFNYNTDCRAQFCVPLAFGVVLFAKVCFFLPAQFWKFKALDLH